MTCPLCRCLWAFRPRAERKRGSDRRSPVLCSECHNPAQGQKYFSQNMPGFVLCEVCFKEKSLGGTYAGHFFGSEGRGKGLKASENLFSVSQIQVAGVSKKKEKESTRASVSNVTDLEQPTVVHANPETSTRAGSSRSPLPFKDDRKSSFRGLFGNKADAGDVVRSATPGGTGAVVVDEELLHQGRERSLPNSRVKKGRAFEKQACSKVICGEEVLPEARKEVREADEVCGWEKYAGGFDSDPFRKSPDPCRKSPLQVGEGSSSRNGDGEQPSFEPGGSRGGEDKSPPGKLILARANLSSQPSGSAPSIPHKGSLPLRGVSKVSVGLVRRGGGKDKAAKHASALVSKSGHPRKTIKV